MTHAVVIHEHGGPEVLRWESVDAGEPGPGEVLIRQTAVGLNYLDVYERTGLYPSPLPMGLGREAAGAIEQLGPGVRNLAPGDRVAYVSGLPGAYAERRVMPANRLVRIPEGVSDRLAAAAMLKGLTAHYLLRRTFRVRKGSSVVIHAAAGGVGLIAVQWARQLGARVIGVVGSESKAERARSSGCHHVLVMGRDELATSIRELTAGEGADVVYDSVGKDTFFSSLDSLRRLGMMVSFGNASGPPPSVNVLELGKRGSLFLTRPALFDYIAKRGELLRAAKELFAVIGSGAVRIEIGQTWPLSDAAQAHRALEARQTVGSTVLLP